VNTPKVLSDKEIEVIFESGLRARTRPESSLEECSYRRSDKKAHWVRGFHEGRCLLDLKQKPTEAQCVKGKTEIKNIRVLLQ